MARSFASRFRESDLWELSDFFQVAAHGDYRNLKDYSAQTMGEKLLQIIHPDNEVAIMVAMQNMDRDLNETGDICILWRAHVCQIWQCECSYCLLLHPLNNEAKPHTCRSW